MTIKPDPIDMAYGFDPTKAPADGLRIMVFDKARALQLLLTSVVDIAAEPGGDYIVTIRGRTMVDLDVEADPVPDPDPTPDPDPVPDPTPVPDPIPTPPVTGRTVATSASDLIAKLQALPSGNHTIGIADGHHDRCVIRGVNTGGTVTILPENPGKAVFDRLHVESGSVGLTFKGIGGLPKSSIVPSKSREFLFMALPGSKNIRFEGGLLQGRSDAADHANWTKADWVAWKIGAVQLRGADCASVGVTAQGINFGFEAAQGGINGLIEDCTAFGVSGDGGRINANGATFRRNRFTDFVLIDANHPDGIQAFGNYAGGKYALLSDLTIEDNTILEWTVRGDNPLRKNPSPGMKPFGVMQGIGFHNSPYANVTIRGNKIASAHAVGMALRGINGLTLEGNTVWNVDNGTANYDGRFPWIDASGCVVSAMSGNMAEGFKGQASGAATDYAALPAV